MIMALTHNAVMEDGTMSGERDRVRGKRPFASAGKGTHSEECEARLSTSASQPLPECKTLESPVVISKTSFVVAACFYCIEISLFACPTKKAGSFSILTTLLPGIEDLLSISCSDFIVEGTVGLSRSLQRAFDPSVLSVLSVFRTSTYAQWTNEDMII